MRRLAIIITIVCGLTSLAVRAADQPAGPAGRSAAGGISSPEISKAITAIYETDDPAVALRAYQAGAKSDTGNLPLNRAYILRMIELGVPENALDQARVVEKAEPTDGLAMGVIAFCQARQDNMPEAVAGIVLALNSMPDDPFLLRTAGQFAAWYEQQDRPEIPAYLAEALQEACKKAAGQDDFKTAYAEAKQAYVELDAATTQMADGAAPSSPISGGPDVGPTPVPQEPPIAQADQPAAVDGGQAVAAGPDAVGPDIGPAVNVYNTYNYGDVFNNAGDSGPMDYGMPAYGTIGLGAFYGPAWGVSFFVSPFHRAWRPPEGRWDRRHVVFVGPVRCGGVLIGHSRGHDVVVDRSHNVYFGHAQDVFRNHNRTVEIKDARHVTFGKGGTVAVRTAPATLVLPGKGAVVDSRTHKPIAPQRPVTAITDGRDRGNSSLATPTRGILAGKGGNDVRPTPAIAQAAARPGATRSDASAVRDAVPPARPTGSIMPLKSDYPAIRYTPTPPKVGVAPDRVGVISDKGGQPAPARPAGTERNDGVIKTPLAVGDRTSSPRTSIVPDRRATGLQVADAPSVVRRSTVAIPQLDLSAGRPDIPARPVAAPSAVSPQPTRSTIQPLRTDALPTRIDMPRASSVNRPVTNWTDTPATPAPAFSSRASDMPSRVQPSMQAPAPTQIELPRPQGQIRPAEINRSDVKPVDVRPADVRPVEVRPADIRPVEARPQVTIQREAPVRTIAPVEAPRPAPAFTPSAVPAPTMLPPPPSVRSDARPADAPSAGSSRGPSHR